MENASPVTEINQTIPPFSRTLSQNQLVLTRLDTATFTPVPPEPDSPEPGLLVPEVQAIIDGVG